MKLLKFELLNTARNKLMGFDPLTNLPYLKYFSNVVGDYLDFDW